MILILDKEYVVFTIFSLARYTRIKHSNTFRVSEVLDISGKHHNYT